MAKRKVWVENENGGTVSDGVDDGLCGRDTAGRRFGVCCRRYEGIAARKWVE